MMPYGDIWVIIGPGNGLLPDGTKPLLEPMLTYSQRCSVGTVSQEVLIHLIRNMCSDITLKELLTYRWVSARKTLLHC